MWCPRALHPDAEPQAALRHARQQSRLRLVLEAQRHARGRRALERHIDVDPVALLPREQVVQVRRLPVAQHARLAAVGRVHAQRAALAGSGEVLAIELLRRREGAYRYGPVRLALESKRRGRTAASHSVREAEAAYAASSNLAHSGAFDRCAESAVELCAGSNELEIQRHT
jgi:hypothetical protein